MNPVNERCDIKAIIKNCLVILNKQYKDRIWVEKKFLEAPIVVKGNVGKLHQVFTYLLVNLIHAIEKSGTITIIIDSDSQNATININDTGCGINEEHLSKIIEPFFTKKDPCKGTVLGLAITYSIISELYGQIVYQSEINKGASVKITLPLYS